MCVFVFNVAVQIIKMKQSTLVMVERELSERMSQQAPRGA